METLLPIIEGWFASKGEHLAAFAAADCRLEGWFKGELLVLFGRLKREGAVEDFERELNIPSELPGKRFQVDFKLRLSGDDHLCELKALCISQAAGTPRNLKFYFRDDHVGLVKDMQKLGKLPARNKWLVAFVYPAPSPVLWAEAVASVPPGLAHCRPVNSPTSSPSPLFVSLWRFDVGAG